jgi:uncharacterized zinc-type alcohol dehydrogenase-like protein
LKEFQKIMPSAKGYAAHDAKSQLAPFSFDRRTPREHDVAVQIEFCGVCHSDIHQARNEWKNAKYPMVPGHEIVGSVTSVGSAVTRFKVGQKVAVGVIVDSCRECANCKAGEEQYCEKGAVETYNGKEYDGSPTYGGYSDHIVTDEHFVHTISPDLDPAGVAPLLCAGITTYSPLRHWGVTKGKKVGVVGLGGLGHLGLKFAHSFGAHTVQFTTSESKKEDALRLGADEVILSNHNDQMAAHKGSFDFILDTVSAPHDLNAYLHLLRLNGTMCQVGIPEEPASIPAFSLLANRRSLAGSGIGGMKETQEMLDYCAEHKIVSDVEIIPIQQVNEAYERVIRSDVKYRFVIDMKSLKA